MKIKAAHVGVKPICAHPAKGSRAEPPPWPHVRRHGEAHAVVNSASKGGPLHPPIAPLQALSCAVGPRL